jgi:GWxTD domain-containing protein
VRYLLTDDERKEFGRLKSDEARSAYAESFWRRLDPDPATPINEFRETYEARCAQAAARFEPIGGPAWASDRARVFILLGEPQSVRRETAGLLAVEKEVWLYPTGDSASGIEIPFFRCPNGAYRLDPTCPGVAPSSVSNEWFRANAVRWLTFGTPLYLRSQVNRYLASLAGSGAEPISRPARTPTPVRADEPEGSSPFVDATYFFRAQDGSVLTLFAIEVPERPASGDATGTIRAAVTLEERLGAATRALLLDPPADGGRVYVGRSYLPSRSSHAARFAVQDAGREEIRVRNRRLDVPDLSGFSASSVVPAERFGPAGDDPRVVVGSEEVVPRPDAVFRNGELLRLYLQVYGATADPRTSMPRVDVAFHFTCDAKPRPRAIRQPFKVTGAAGASMGLALPIGDWPEGSYRVDVDLHDRVTGARATTAGAFRIAAR